MRYSSSASSPPPRARTLTLALALALTLTLALTRYLLTTDGHHAPLTALPGAAEALLAPLLAPASPLQHWWSGLG